MIISIDIDDVIFLTTVRLAKMAFKNCGKDYFPTRGWNFTNYPEDVRNEYWRLDSSEHLFAGGLCHKDIPYHLNGLLKNPHYRVVFITGREASQIDGTVRQFRKHGMNVKKKMIHAVGKVKSKIDVIMDVNALLHIDDAPRHVNDCIEHGIGAVLITNDCTPQNHCSRGRLPESPDLIHALCANGFAR